MGDISNCRSLGRSEGEHRVKLCGWQEGRGSLLRIIFRNPHSGQEFTLLYRLYAHPLVEAWKNLWRDAQVAPPEVTFYGSGFYQKKDLAQGFRRVIELINEYGQHHISEEIHENLSQAELNQLHSWFERLDVHAAYAEGLAPVEVRNAVRDLNTLVHRFEKFLVEGVAHDITIVYPGSRREMLATEDFDLFCVDSFFGDLFLSYATTGVPFVDAFEKGSVFPPVPQKSYAADLHLWFGKDIRFSQLPEMERWLESDHGRNITDRKLALGEIPLGQLVDRNVAAQELIAALGKAPELARIELVDPEEATTARENQVTLSLMFRAPVDQFGTGRISVRLFDEALASAVAALPVGAITLSVELGPRERQNFVRISFPEALPKPGKFVGGRGYLSAGLYASGAGGRIKELYLFTETMAWFGEDLCRVGDFLFATHLFMVHERGSELEVSIANPGTYPRALWPGLSEIYRHLEHTPFLDLSVEFDHEGCLAEAEHLLAKFVRHRDYGESAGEGPAWKSLALQAIHGDPRKTEHYTAYGLEEKPAHFLTEIANDCPKTMAFLRELSYLPRCDRVRFMLLEPGARIPVHSDAEGQDVALALNIALNMPAGCDFYIDTARDGSHTEYTQKIPFRPGTAMYINTAKYHYVENNSPYPRIHIIVHGPLRMNEKTLTHLARRQNQARNEAEVVTQLVIKRARQNEALPTDGILFRNWVSQGMRNKLFEPYVKIVVADDASVPEPLRTEILKKFTAASLFPLPFEVVAAEHMDKWLAGHREQAWETLAIIPAGTQVLNAYPFIYELLRLGARLRRDGKLVAGHGADFPHALPRQFTVLNFSLYKELGAPTEEIDALDIPAELNAVMEYCYPHEKDLTRYHEMKSRISGFIEGVKSGVFYFNNETLRQVAPPSFRPERLVSVAAGFKPFTTVRDLFSAEKVETYLFDYSAEAVDYFLKLGHTRSEPEILALLTEGMEREGIPADIAGTLAAQKFRSFLAEEFFGNFGKFMRAKSRVDLRGGEVGDLFTEHEKILSLIGTNRRVYFWHSNAWRTHAAFFQYTRDELRENYLRLVAGAAARRGMRAWCLRSDSMFEAVVGPNLKDPHVVFSEHLDSEHFREKNFFEIEGVNA